MSFATITTEYLSQLYSTDCEMISSNEEIIIVNVDETNQSTLPGRKPLLTYTLAEKILKNHQVIHF